jgi:hypothetical protein
LRPHYRVAIERRTYLTILPPEEQRVGKPDILVLPSSEAAIRLTPSAASITIEPITGELPLPEEVFERYLEIRDVETQEVVTVIEVLSPTDKASGEGRVQYERKRLRVLASLTNLVEIDLLRRDEPFEMKVPAQKDYRIVVSRSHQHPKADIYLFGIRDPIPDFPIPLRAKEAEPTLPLNDILHTIYDEGSYDLALDYGRSPEPPLSEQDADWAARRLTSPSA